MPMKPHKGESQSDFMSRCVPEMMGDGKRDQDQAVAACSQIWRDKDKHMAEFADPGYQPDGKKRFSIDTKDQVRAAWINAHNGKSAKLYTEAQLSRIRMRISSSWKRLVSPGGPPAADNKSDMLALRSEVILVTRESAPEPEDDETHDEFIERCTDELSDSMDDDDAEEACQLAWDEYGDERGVGNVMHKTHAAEVEGMEFVLSDASPDRYGDIVEVDGWDYENFKKNPIALFGHNNSFPIGKWQNIKLNAGKDLRAELVLAPKGTSDRIDEIRKLVDAGILRAVSVGFRPLEYSQIKGDDGMGMRFIKHELVEASVVSVPANPNALAVAKSLNISPATVRMVFGEHASDNIVQRNFVANRGKHADTKRGATEGKETGEHAESHRESTKGKPMLLSQRIVEAEKGLLTLQDNLEKHLESIDDANPTEEQMVLTEDLTAKVETAARHLKNLKNIELKNATNAGDISDAGEIARRSGGGKIPAEILVPKKKVHPVDYLVRAALITAKSRIDGATLDDTRKKIYGDDEATRAFCNVVLRAASAPALTTVPGWAQELVRTVWAAFMEVLLPMAVYPRLSAAGLSLTFGGNGRIVIPTRNLTPSISGSFVGEGQPIPVRQGSFASQTLTPKKMAVITTWTREMDEHSMPAIEGLLRQAILEDTAISLDAILLDANPSTAIRPAGLRNYATALTPAAGGAGQQFANFVADFKALYGGLLTLTNGNVRNPVLIVNPMQTLAISLIQPPNAATTLFPFMTMIDAGKLLKVGLIESSTVPIGVAIMVDAADFTTAGTEGPRLEISDQATLHMEDTAPQDIVSGSAVPASPVKSMWQTDSLALRLIMMMNWIMRRPVVAHMSGVQWG